MNPNVEAAGPALHWWLSGCSVPEIFTAPYLMSYPKVKPEFLLERETVLPAAAIGYQASDFLSTGHIYDLVNAFLARRSSEKT
ncbi:uncharacterized protein FRV6_01962 [Fusarium oxysporum]|uniref:Uncharacterized protein n=1 Tax=Fusarium oxysporum TaxID=5507 RepID=A0A2H3T4A8_FUSOX|nr:uncharacterized protein FRV6_01962 [Fusarium oxysporum]